MPHQIGVRYSPLVTRKCKESSDTGSDRILTYGDRAKREFVINSATEINILKTKYKILDEEKTVKPWFFKMITTENGYELSDNMKYRYFNTAMDYLQKIISKFHFREGREQKRKVIPFMDMVKEPACNVRQGYYYSKRDQIVETIRKASEEKKKLFRDYDTLSSDEKKSVWSQVCDIKQDCIEEVEKMSSSPATMYLTLKELDDKQYSDVSRFVFEVLFGRPDEAFFTMLKESKEDVYTLEESEEGTVSYYGFNFKREKIAQKYA